MCLILTKSCSFSFLIFPSTCPVKLSVFITGVDVPKLGERDEPKLGENSVLMNGPSSWTAFGFYAAAAAT